MEIAHRRHTTEAVVAGNHFAVGREVDITVQGIGRIQINEIMMYKVNDGKIVSEQFFYLENTFLQRIVETLTIDSDSSD